MDAVGDAGKPWTDVSLNSCGFDSHVPKNLHFVSCDMQAASLSELYMQTRIIFYIAYIGSARG